MEIGTKLREARMTADLTQEQAAEHLMVSRQTMSNWENNKTYPDIVSVIKMSELYGVSLDRLLKGEDGAPAATYVEYLEEATNVVKNKKKLSNVILAAVYLGIWSFALLVFWFFTDGGDAMGYSLMFLWLLLPVTSFVISLLAAKLQALGIWKWIIPAAMGLMYMLAEYATFSAANMISFDKVNSPAWGMLPAGAAISAAGILIGFVLRRMQEKRQGSAL